MKKKFKILIATDYSEAAKNAAIYAVQFAKSINADLMIMHTYDVPELSTPAEVMNGTEYRIELEESELSELEYQRKRLFESLNFSADEPACECFVTAGEAGAEISKAAKNHGVDLIIAGTHGATGFREIFSGSNTAYLIKKSEVPVLAIPVGAEFSSINQIVFATEEREGELPAISFVIDFARKFNAAVTILHISEQVRTEPTEEQALNKFITELKSKILYDKLNAHLIYNTNVIEGINDFCAEKKADWLVMSPQKVSLLQKIFTPSSGTTRKMSFHTVVPLFSVPDQYVSGSEKVKELSDVDEEYLSDEF
ncbi:MAG: universal stress protein [Bacteroidia bacterium]|nr:universal stress protein [Bacteroidia bacterium]